jgi:polyribonucleotide 5'-hydroxyl-kinase
LQSAPLVYYFGHSSPSDNVKLYQHLVSLLAGRVDGRLERDADARASGVIINTAGWGDQAGYDVLLQCIQAFSVDVVLVMGHDKLYSKFSTDVGDHVTVVKLPKSGGVVERVRFTINISVLSVLVNCVLFVFLPYSLCILSSTSPYDFPCSLP